VELFEKRKMFNTALIGKAARISGYDVDGDEINGTFLIKDVLVLGQFIEVISKNGVKYHFHMENFENEELLNIQIWE
jgi:hypothetical protein